MKKNSKSKKPAKELTPVSPDPSLTPNSNETPPAANSLPASSPGSVFLTNDSTSHAEISFMQNDNYSKEIIDEANNVFSLDRLRDLEKDKGKYLDEAKHQINKLFNSIDALKVHTDLFSVKFLMNVGYILNEIEPKFKDKSAYANWRAHNFNRTPEYFQHAKRLIGMGKTAETFRSLGISRLLEVDRLQRDLNKSLEDILKEHSFLDTADDLAGSLFKIKVDSIISYYRFVKAGVDTITLPHVHQLVQFTHEDIPVKEVDRFKRIYDKAPDKDALLTQYVLDKGVITSQEPSTSAVGNSLNSMLADINIYFENKGTNNSDWVNQQQELLDRNILKTAYDNLKWLIKKLKKR